MKSEQIILNKPEIGDADVKRLSDIQPQLVFAFGSVAAITAPSFSGTMKKNFPNSTVIGCTTAGEISDKGVSDNALVLTGARFDRAQVKTAWATMEGSDKSEKTGAKIAEGLKGPDLKAVFVLGQGLEINGTALVDGIRKSVGDKVVITGGLAGDGGAFKKTYTTLNGEVTDNRVVAFGLYGNGIDIGFGSMGGWKPFGPARRVTKSVNNVLYELDGEPALAVYKKYLGEDAKGLPGSGLRYPFAILNDNEDTTGLIRTILAVDEKAGSLTFAGDMPSGGLVRLMHTDSQGLVAGAKTAAETTRKSNGSNAGLGILISCVGRKLVMGDDIDDEVEAVHGILGDGNHVSGFYSYGEICPMEGFSECKLHNQTMTITWLSDGGRA